MDVTPPVGKRLSQVLGIGTWRRRTAVVMAAAACLATALIGVSSANAEAPKLVELGQFCTGSGGLGGECSNGEGVAVNRTGAGGVEAGDVYVAERGGQRIQEFTKAGAFVRAWGKDVIIGGVTTFEVCEVAANCKVGVASAEAGAFNQARGIAIDQATGNIYVADANNRRIDVFSAKGKFEGAFGWKVELTGAAEELQFCTTATGCQVGKSGAPGAGALREIFAGALAVDPTDGNLWVGDEGNHRLNEFEPHLTGEEVTSVSFVRAVGWGVALSGAEGTGNLTSGSTSVAAAVTSKGAFLIGQAITGSGIAPGTTITAVAATTLTLSKAATATEATTLTAVEDPGNEKVNEQQTLTLTPIITAGKFKLTFSAPNPQAAGASPKTTEDIPFNATAGEVQGKLEALTNLGAGNVAVSLNAGGNPGGGAAPGGPWTIEFKGKFADVNVGPLTVAAGSEPLVGGSATVVTARDGAKGGFETCISSCGEGSQGSGGGQFAQPLGAAVDSGGNVYATSSGANCENANTPCRMMKFNPDGTFKELFGSSSGGDAKCQLNWTKGFGNEHNASGIAIDPAIQHVLVTRKRTLTELEICEFDDEGELVQRSPAVPVSTATPAGTSVLHQSLAIGTEERVYLQAPIEANNSWPVRIFGIVPPAPAALEPITKLAPTCATFEGEVTVPKPGGNGYDPSYRFEYSPDNGLTWLRLPANADASLGTTTPGTYPVEGEACGLLPNTTYRVRLVTTTSSVTTSEERTFTTGTAPPILREIRARDASQGSVTIEAKINPNGTATNYRFEWGPTTAYGHLLPTEVEGNLAKGQEFVQVTGNITGLSAATTYHYRLVARSAAGTTTSADQTLETLNSCGLPDGRCFELVSPRELGPVAAPGRGATVGVGTQVSTAPGSIAYEIDLGLPEATKGGAVAYVGSRGSSGWSSAQLSPTMTEEPIETSNYTNPSEINALSPDLGCAVVTSSQQLTDDPVARLATEAGGANLYRRNPNGYTLITNLPPEGPLASRITDEYRVISTTDDCGRVVFETQKRYPGVPSVGGEETYRLYEWDEGDLRTVGWIPNGVGGEAVAEAAAGQFETGFYEDRYNAVSEDGSRIFFSAKRLAGNNAEEVGKTGVFVRIGGTATLDVSLSETAVADKGATFQGATPDGSRVYFVANAGLTAESNSEGSDLYECHIVEGGGGEPECVLTDLSVTPEGGPAEVGGILGAQPSSLAGVADNGSRAYFVARGQLDPGRGPTLAENKAASTFSLYRYERSTEEAHFIGTIANPGVGRVTLGGGVSVSSSVSPDGRFLLFESAAEVTSYDSGGVPEAYLYDAEGGSEPAVCLSCRQDDKPSVNSGKIGTEPLARGSLIIRNGQPMAFFVSRDGLAPGAEGESLEGQWALYEWAHGQVFHIATDKPGTELPELTGTVSFAAASIDGTDLYFRDPVALNWENPEGRYALWDARVGGGFPEPSAPPPGCDPTAESSCQGAAAAAPGSASAGSASFNGPGNVKEASKKKKHKSHRKKKHRRAERARHANANRRAGK